MNLKKMLVFVLSLTLCFAMFSTSFADEAAFTGKYIVDVEYVKAHLEDENVIFIDARGGEGAQSGTLKNAIAISWPELADMTKKPGENGWGHMLSPEELSAKLSQFGLSKDKEIILFSATNAGWGEDGRILWELKAAGFTNLKMVDGGIQAMKNADLPLVAGKEMLDKSNDVNASNVVIEALDYTNSINTDTLTAEKDQYKIIDSREADEYEGATKFGEAKGGHIPGAVNIPYSTLYKEDGTLKANAELEKMFTEAGFQKDDAIVTYCTGGIRSAFMQLVMEMCGFKNVKNYEGSYYNWATVNPVE